MIVRLKIEDTDEGLRATLWTQNDPSEAESRSSQEFLVESKAAARTKARDLARQHGLKTFRVLDRAAD